MSFKWDILPTNGQSEGASKNPYEPEGVGDDHKAHKDTWPGSRRARVQVWFVHLWAFLTVSKVEDVRQRGVLVKHLLRVANFVCLLGHLSMVVATIAASAPHDPVQFEVPVTRMAVRWNNTGANGFKIELRDAGHLRIDLLCGGFFFLSAIAHAFALVASCFPWYYAMIDRCICPWRWIEYFFSASVQITAVCAVSGIRDAWVLSLVFVSMSVTQLFGLLAELYNQGPAAPDQNNYKTWTLEGQWTRWLPWSLGFLPYFAAYGTLLSNFGVALDDLYREDPDLARRFPTWVYTAISGTFLVFTSFAFVQPFYMARRAPSQWYQTELWYAFLSLTAKLYLGSFLLSNVIRFGSFEESVSPS